VGLELPSNTYHDPALQQKPLDTSKPLMYAKLEHTIEEMLREQGVQTAGPDNQQEIRELARTVFASMKTVADLATALTNMLMGAERSNQPVHDASELGEYLRLSRGYAREHEI
jgi:hypothetical protein